MYIKLFKSTLTLSSIFILTCCGGSGTKKNITEDHLKRLDEALEEEFTNIGDNYPSGALTEYVTIHELLDEDCEDLFEYSAGIDEDDIKGGKFTSFLINNFFIENNLKKIEDPEDRFNLLNSLYHQTKYALATNNNFKEAPGIDEDELPKVLKKYSECSQESDFLITGYCLELCPNFCKDIIEMNKSYYGDIEPYKSYICPKNYNNNESVYYYGIDFPNRIKATYENYKEEFHHYASLADLKGDFQEHLKLSKELINGDFFISQLLRRNKVKLKHVLPIISYCEMYYYTDVPKKFKEAFHPAIDSNERVKKCEDKYHWRNLFQEAFDKFSTVPGHNCPETLFIGIQEIKCMDQFEGTCYGPQMASSNINAARKDILNSNGMILVIKPKRYPEQTKYKALNISLMYTHFRTNRYIARSNGLDRFLLFDHKFDIEAFIDPSDYDKNQYYYEDLFITKDNTTDPIDHISYNDQKKDVNNLRTLKKLLKETTITTGTHNELLYRQEIDFGQDVNEVSTEQKIDLLHSILTLAYKEKSHWPLSEYEQTLIANYKHIANLAHEYSFPPSILEESISRFKKAQNVSLEEDECCDILKGFFNGTLGKDY